MNDSETDREAVSSSGTGFSSAKIDAAANSSTPTSAPAPMLPCTISIDGRDDERHRGRDDRRRVPQQPQRIRRGGRGGVVAHDLSVVSAVGRTRA